MVFFQTGAVGIRSAGGLLMQKLVQPSRVRVRTVLMFPRTLERHRRRHPEYGFWVLPALKLRANDRRLSTWHTRRLLPLRIDDYANRQATEAGSTRHPIFVPYTCRSTSYPAAAVRMANTIPLIPAPRLGEQELSVSDEIPNEGSSSPPARSNTNYRRS